MKRTFTMLMIGVVASLTVGCAPTLEDKAAEWLKANTNTIICADEERHSLYYFELNNEGSYYDPQVFVTKVDLLTNEAKPLSILPYVEQNDSKIRCCVLPEDKGQGNPEATFVLSTFHKGLVYNTKSEQFTAFCMGDLVYAHGKYLVCCQDGKSYYSTGFSDISVYDATGTKLTDSRRFLGTIAKQDVVVDLHISDKGHIVGSYYYAKYAKNGKTPERMLLDGYVKSDNSVTIHGYNTNDARTETWTGTLVGGTISAQFDSNFDGRTYLFTLVEQVPQLQ